MPKGDSVALPPQGVAGGGSSRRFVPSDHCRSNTVVSRSHRMNLRGMLWGAALAVLPLSAGLHAQTPPNIIVVMGDDIGWSNIGVYNQGVMSGRTPNLDRLANEGMRFTDYYAEASCTAGRANWGIADPHRADDGRAGGIAARHPRRGHHDRASPQGYGIRDRSVRQEPPGRPEQVPADGAWLRRVLRLPIPL